jgi:hypothetical protein
MAPQFKRNDFVTYTVRKQVISARIDRAHRDGTLTLTALFFRDDAGNDLPGYLGYRYRVSPDGLAPDAA